MVKKICVLVFLCAGVSAFSQTQPKQVLAKADVDNFIKNFAAIEEVLDSHQGEFSSFLEATFAPSLLPEIDAMAQESIASLKAAIHPRPGRCHKAISAGISKSLRFIDAPACAPAFFCL
ncbi:MAG: hypothetical protein LBT68_03270 [Spirochaetales bacterium]|nr:hypothetical protein [Spirochaetales bacterium]